MTTIVSWNSRDFLDSLTKNDQCAQQSMTSKEIIVMVKKRKVGSIFSIVEYLLCARDGDVRRSSAKVRGALLLLGVCLAACPRPWRRREQGFLPSDVPRSSSGTVALRGLMTMQSRSGFDYSAIVLFTKPDRRLPASVQLVSLAGYVVWLPLLLRGCPFLEKTWECRGTLY